jgi:hypothetical protein
MVLCCALLTFFLRVSVFWYFVEVFPATVSPAFPAAHHREIGTQNGTGRDGTRARGFVLTFLRRRASQHVSLSPITIGDIVESALVPTQFEHKMIS